MVKPKIIVSKSVRMLRADRVELCLHVRGKTGYHAALVQLRPGRFDTRELDVEVDEYPSGQTVLSQGWDLHKFERRMAVPTFTAFLDGRDLGDVWFDVPNYLGHRTGVLDTEFGFHLDRDGVAELRLLVIEADRKRFGWDMVERIEIAPDDRGEAPLAPRKNLPKDQPWLFLHGRTPDQVRADFAKVKAFRAPLKNVEEIVRDYTGIAPENMGRVKSTASDKPRKTPPPYMPIDQVTAAAALVTNSPTWIGLAHRTLLRLVNKRTWALDPQRPRLMGEENDMTIGHPLLSMSMLYHFLRDHLGAQEREAAIAKAREYGRKLYDFSVLQKRYATGMGHITSHESCPLLGLGVACMVFWDDLHDAPRWLAWTHGRQLAGALCGPADGLHSWPTYGPQFLSSYAAAAYDFAGDDAMFRTPFFRNLPFALLRALQRASLENDFNFLWIMARAATYQAIPEAAWAYRHIYKLQSNKRGAEHFIGWQDMLWRPRVRGRAPSDALRKSHLFRDVGLAMMRTDGNNGTATLRCDFQNGLSVGGSRFEERCRYGMETHDANADGGISIWVDGDAITYPAPSQYRRGFALQSVVTVNGDGHYMEGRVLGTRPEKSWLSKTISFQDSAEKTTAVGDNTGAYRGELGVRRARRRVTLDKSARRIVVENEIDLRKPQQIAARFQAVGGIDELGDGRYRLKSMNGRSLNVTVASPEQYRIRIGQTQMVLPYSYGFNVEKGKKSKPVLKGLKLPKQQFLEIAVPGKAKSGRFMVTFEMES